MNRTDLMLEHLKYLRDLVHQRGEKRSPCTNRNKDIDEMVMVENILATIDLLEKNISAKPDVTKIMKRVRKESHSEEYQIYLTGLMDGGKGYQKVIELSELQTILEKML